MTDYRSRRDPAALMRASLAVVTPYLEARYGPLPSFTPKRVHWANHSWHMSISADTRGWWRLEYVDNSVLELTSRHSLLRLNYITTHETAHLYTTEALRLAKGDSWGKLSASDGFRISDEEALHIEGAAEFAAVMWGLEQRPVNPLALEVLTLACIEAEKAGYVAEVSPAAMGHWLTGAPWRAFVKDFDKYIALLAHVEEPAELGLGVYLCAQIVARGRRSLQELLERPLAEDEFRRLALE